MNAKEMEVLEKYALWQKWFNYASKWPIYEDNGNIVVCAGCRAP